MSNWTHTLTVIAQESLIPQANQLALAVGTSEDDINTFKTADWTDGTSNYAVANTRAVAQIMEYFGAISADAGSPLAAALSATIFPSVSIDADDVATWTGVDKTKIQVFIDHDPFDILKMLGFVRL